MKTLEYNFADKSAWGDGPWQSEVDKKQWIDKTTGLPCLIVRSASGGALCGYVGVDSKHPLFLKHYDTPDVEVHGGLTFAGKCQEREHGVCHLVEDNEDDDVWWFGFDCAHGGDVSPGYRSLLPEELIYYCDDYETYRDFNYVTEQVEQLAVQLLELGKPKQLEYKGD